MACSYEKEIEVNPRRKSRGTDRAPGARDNRTENGRSQILHSTHRTTGESPATHGTADPEEIG